MTKDEQHELLDRVYVLGENFQSVVMEHDAMLERARLDRLARVVRESLGNLYLAIGAEEVSDDGR